MNEALEVARNVLSGEVGIVAGSVQLNNLLNHHLDNEEYIQSDFKIFMVVDSEVDHLPVGKERETWSNEMLSSKDKEIEEVESFYKKDVISACQKLINKYDEPE